MNIAVVGAHLSGLPLNKQLTDRGGTLVRPGRTKPLYRLYELPNSTPPKPGLIRVRTSVARGIDVEVWDLAPAAFADFVQLIPPPMCIGTLELEDGEPVKGFLVEPYAVEGAKEITHFGGWRAYLNSLGGNK